MVYARLLQHTNVVIIPKPWLTDLRAPVWDYSDHHLVDSFDPVPNPFSASISAPATLQPGTIHQRDVAN